MSKREYHFSIELDKSIFKKPKLEFQNIVDAELKTLMAALYEKIVSDYSKVVPINSKNN